MGFFLNRVESEDESVEDSWLSLLRRELVPRGMRNDPSGLREERLRESLEEANTCTSSQMAL